MLKAPSMHFREVWEAPKQERIWKQPLCTNFHGSKGIVQASKGEKQPTFLSSDAVCKPQQWLPWHSNPQGP